MIHRLSLHQLAFHCALALAVLTLSIALASQYWGGLIPCDLCLKQRWPYYLAIPILLMAWAAGDPKAHHPTHTHPTHPQLTQDMSLRRWLSLGAGLIFFLGGGLALYHVGVEQKLWPGPSTCGGGLAMPESIDALQSMLTRGAVSCDTPAFTIWGISMAGFNAIISFVISALLIYAGIRPSSHGFLSQDQEHKDQEYKDE